MSFREFLFQICLRKDQILKYRLQERSHSKTFCLKGVEFKTKGPFKGLIKKSSFFIFSNSETNLKRLPFINHQNKWFITRFLIKLLPTQIIEKMVNFEYSNFQNLTSKKWGT